MSEAEIKDQMDAMRKLVELSQQRSQMSATRSYMNAERTLSVWIRTALGAMVFGLAIDQFGLVIHQMPANLQAIVKTHDQLTHLTGVGLIIFSMIIAFVCGLRFVAYSRNYKKEFSFPEYHHAWLPATYAFIVVLFGIALLFLMVWV